jgi:hypothetical protein
MTNQIDRLQPIRCGAAILFHTRTGSSRKEIAAYLKRDERTVRRWERTEGLPVRRHVHQRQASVYVEAGTGPLAEHCHPKGPAGIVRGLGTVGPAVEDGRSPRRSWSSASSAHRVAVRPRPAAPPSTSRCSSFRSRT